jgi:CheY-like chemotaxis protein
MKGPGFIFFYLFLIQATSEVDEPKIPLSLKAKKCTLNKNLRTVLCVDDDADDREIIGTVIQKIDSNYHVVHAENGLEAHTYLNAAKQNGDFPCLIILDVNMPVMDGKETLVEIKKDEVLKKIPVAMFTTSTSHADKTFFLQHGVEMVTKPSDYSNITKEVEKLLKHCA